jgi:Fe-S cluster biogenesis protein NfuA
MENHPLYSKVQHALDSIRPYLVADGGNVEIVEITPEYIATCFSGKL